MPCWSTGETPRGNNADQYLHEPAGVTVRKDTTLEEVARLMLEHRIGGVPVINPTGTLCGVLTESDFTAKEQGIPFSTFRAPQVLGHWLGGERLEQIYAAARRMTARAIMSPHVITVTEVQSAEDAVRLLLRHNIHRLPVVRDGVPVGMVTRHDLLRLLLRHSQDA
jgi:CBS domain-containing protein